MPEWIHNRADHIRAKNPGMPKSESFAIATQQAYGAGKAPKKDFGTSEGKREAHKKYDAPKSQYEKKSDPRSVGKAKFGGLALETVVGFKDELQKIALATVGDMTNSAKKPSSMFSKPKMSSKPNVKEPETPSSTMDHFSSSKTLQPPPVTMATTAPGT
jgi:hypothetical protein